MTVSSALFFELMATLRVVAWSKAKKVCTTKSTVKKIKTSMTIGRMEQHTNISSSKDNVEDQLDVEPSIWFGGRPEERFEYVLAKR